MRNLKKILALVLALMMVLSVMVFASAANYDDYSDKDQVSPEYAEAVEVLTGMDIFWGSENSFYPKSNVTRAEVATLLYRVMTTDVSGSQVGIYKDYGMFDDVLETNWFAGYVNFAANSEYVVGVGDGKFNPEGDVTGYEWITMLLRAVGYDANGEISGSEWKITAARLAKQAGILGDFNETTLNSALTREEVAYLLFNAINVPQVEYTPAFGYDDENVWGVKNPTIGEDQFDLTENGRTTIDAWGRPGYTWTYNTGNKVTTIEEAYLAQYTTATTECQIAEDTHQATREVTYALYTNGTVHNVGSKVVNSLDTVTKVGAQGRLTEVYKDRIVMVDTLLANVTSVQAATFDAAGHLRTPATMKLEVYDVAGTTDVTLTNGATNWTYTKGQMLLVNAVQNNSAVCNGTDNHQYVEIVGVADSFVGAQTNIWINANQHTISGTTYQDNNRYLKDDAGQDSTKNYTWYKDQYGNVIGSSVIPATYTYGILKNIRWVVGTPGYAQATLIDPASGAESTVTVNSLDGWATNDWATANAIPTYSVGGHYNFSGATANMSDESKLNTAYEGIALYRVETLTNGTVNLDGQGVVSYRHATTITTTSTTFVGVGGQPVYVDDNTVFTVRTGTSNNYTYSRYVGKNNVPSYVQNTVRAFYVDLNGDKIVDYVYVTEGTPTYAGAAFVMATSGSYKTMYEGSTAYDVLTSALVGGVPTTDGVKATSASGYVRTLAGRVGVPHYVTYGADGSITSINAFNENAQTSDYINYYVKLRTPYLSGTTLLGYTADGTKVAYSLNVSAVSGVYGDYATLDASVINSGLVDVYVVYNSLYGINYATTAYVVNKAATDPGDTPSTTVVTYGAALTADRKLVVTRYENGVAKADGTNNTSFTYAAYTNGVLVADGSGSSNIDKAAATKTVDLSTALDTAGTTYYVVVTINGVNYSTNTLYV